MTYLDTLVSEHPDDGGFGFIAYKPVPIVQSATPEHSQALVNSSR